jgi:DNA primase catalytic core
MEDNATLEQIKEKLEQYLRDQGVKFDSRGQFRCIHPDHADKNPSSGIVKGNPEVFHCFSCGFSGNIFHAALFLEGMPREGIQFFNDTVPKIAERYDIPFEKIEITDEDRRRISMYAAHKDAAHAIRTAVPKIAQYLEVRGWTEDTGAHFGVGTIESLEKYISDMKTLGWSSSSLMPMGLLDTEIFDPDSLIFPIHDHKGRTVGFGRRWMDWKSKADHRRKYQNSAESEIYNKSSILYNLHNVKKGKGPVAVVEGYADVISLYQEHPAVRTVAICGTSFTKDQLNALREHRMMNVELAMDGDDSGQVALTRIVETLSKDPHGFNVKIIAMPPGEDPGSMAGQWSRLQRHSPFEWWLIEAKRENSKTPEELCQLALPTVMLEPDRIERHQMVRELSNITGVPRNTISDEVERRASAENFEKRERENSIREAIMEMLRKGRPLREVVAEGSLQIQMMEDEFRDIDTTTEEFYAEELQKVWMNTEDEDPSQRLKIPDMQMTDEWLDGVPTTQLYHVIGGVPHAGKTSFLRFISWRVAMTNPSAMVIYHNVDEPIQRMVPGIVAVQSGAKINQVKHLSRLTDDDLRERIRDAWGKVKEMGLSGKFIIKDAKAGTTIDDIERMVKSYQDKYPDRRLVYIFDNFHKLQDYPGLDIRKKFTACSKRIKLLTLRYDFPLFMTAELRKVDTRLAKTPRPEDLKETGSIHYDADVGWLIHNDLNVDPDSRHVWTRTSSGTDLYGDRSAPFEDRMPVMDLHWFKNRETGHVGITHFKYDPARNHFKEARIPRPKQHEDKPQKPQPTRKPVDEQQEDLPF